MLFKVKKFIYLLNDITNIALGKERAQIIDNNNKLQFRLIIVSIVMVLSIILNIYLLISK